MNASRRYLPLTLALFLTTAATGSALAGTSLDPYERFKAPVPTKKKAAPAAIQSADEVEQPQTYISVPMGHLDQDGKKPTGILGKTMAGMSGMASPFKAAGNHVVKGSKFIGNGIANSAKASGDVAKKGATVIGSGIKSTGDKLKDSTDAVSNKIAVKPKKSPNKVASIDDWYANETAKAVAHNNDGGKHAKALINRDPKKSSGTETAYLQPKGKLAKLPKLKLNPFAKGKDGKPDPIRPESGFAAAVDNPDEEILAEITAKNKKPETPAKQGKPEAAPAPAEEHIQPIASTSPEKTIAKAPATAPKKSGKFGGLNLAKLKPGMPAMPKFGKGKKSVAPEHHVAATPAKHDIKPVEKKHLEPLKPVHENVAQANEDPFDLNDSAPTPQSQHSPTAFRTGDKEIDAIQPSKGPGTSGNTIATQPTKKKSTKGVVPGIGGVASVMKGGFGKMNFLNKKKPAPAQTAASDAAKQM